MRFLSMRDNKDSEMNEGMCQRTKQGMVHPTLRFVFFSVLISQGVEIFKTFEVLRVDEAFLVSSAIAAVMIFLIPSGEGRDPRDLISLFALSVGTYGILLKFPPWAGDLIGQPLATGVSVLLMLSFVFLLLVSLVLRRPKGDASKVPTN